MGLHLQSHNISNKFLLTVDTLNVVVIINILNRAIFIHVVAQSAVQSSSKHLNINNEILLLMREK